jgi:PAS domain S-box-containing protein
LISQSPAAESALLKENQDLRNRLAEAEEVLRAIRYDEVDALLVTGPRGDQVHTIEGAERPYRLLVEQMQEAAVTLSADDHILYVNPRCVQMLGIRYDMVIAAPVASFVEEADRPRFASMLRASRTSIQRGEVRLRAADGRVIPVHCSASPLPSDGRNNVCLVLTDLTDQKRQEAVIAAQQRRQQKAILAERNRMAHELHDSLAQGLTAIKLQLEAAEDALSASEGDARHNVTRAKEIAANSLAEAKRAIRALRLLALQDGGLAPALQRLVDTAVEGTDVTARFVVHGAVSPLPEETETELYRIGQEAFTNAIRHAGAAVIEIELTYSDTGVELRVRDDGQGFDIQAQHDGFGLSGMQVRAERIHGSLSLRSASGAGTEVAVAIGIPAHPLV